MSKLDSVTKKIQNIGKDLDDATRKRLDNLTKPRGSLGRLEELARRFISIRGDERALIKDKVIFTIAADHGVTEEGISLYPKEVTAQMVMNFLNGGAAINVLARHCGARVVVADVGVAADIPSNKNLVVSKIGRGTRNIAKGPAMSKEQALKSIEAGIDIFEHELVKGIDIIGTGDMGIGNTTASSAMIAVFSGAAVDCVVGRGTGLDNNGVAKKIVVVEKAIRLNAPDPLDPIDVLSKVGGFEIGAISGVILAACSRRIPVVIDGFISGAAALLAYQINAAVKDCLIASHLSSEKGHKTALEHMGLEPLLDLDMRLGEGTGAALAIGLVDAAMKLLNEMATFKSAGVSERTK